MGRGYDEYERFAMHCDNIEGRVFTNGQTKKSNVVESDCRRSRGKVAQATTSISEMAFLVNIAPSRPEGAACQKPATRGMSLEDLHAQFRRTS
jgi:hypothetical protein